MAFTLDRLSELNAVSGFEDEAREYLVPLIKDKCDDLSIDSMGNITAYKKGQSDKYKILIGTNIDEVGFIVSEITDTGFIKFKAVGVHDARMLVSKRVSIGKDRIKGVIGMKAIHLQKKAEREASVKVSDLYIDIGETKKKNAEKRVKLGDMIAFDTAFSDKGDVIKGKALDRFGTVSVFSAMDMTPVYDTYFVFSTQSEIPCSVMGRGMRIASYRINPDFALIINTVNTDDFYSSKSVSARLGGGAVMEYMDRNSVSNSIFQHEIENLARDKGIDVQMKTSSQGLSIAGAVNVASFGAVSATVGIPCRYSRTPASYMNKNDIKAVSDLCAAFVRESGVIIDGIVKKIN